MDLLLVESTNDAKRDYFGTLYFGHGKWNILVKFLTVVGCTEQHIPLTTAGSGWI